MIQMISQSDYKQHNYPFLYYLPRFNIYWFIPMHKSYKQKRMRDVNKKSNASTEKNMSQVGSSELNFIFSPEAIL